MKKLFFLAGCSALVLSSCSNEIDETGEIPLVNGKAVIEFNAYTPNMTRAVISDLQANGFKLITSMDINQGLETIPSHTIGYADGKWCVASKTGTEGEWTADENQLEWPNESTDVKFYAFYEDKLSSSVVYGEESLMCEDITIDGTQDLMSARAIVNSETRGAVSLNFKHLLANMQIYIKAPDTEYTYKVTDVTLNGATKCHLIFGEPENDKHFDIEDEIKGEVNQGPDGWLFDELNIYTISDDMPDGVTVDNNKEANIGSIYAIPFIGSYLEITYTRQEEGKEPEEKTATLSVEPVAGSINKYIITLPADNTIKFAVTLSDWGTVDDVEEEL